jgi:hypothetical protein
MNVSSHAWYRSLFSMRVASLDAGHSPVASVLNQWYE